MSRPQNYFKKLAAVPVHYARPPIAPYATRGKSYRFYTTEPFELKLTRCFEELWNVCPLGKAEVITSAGAYVNKSGYHGKGRAFDLDAIFWKQRDFVTLNYPSDSVFYLGIEAIIRRHFGTVLNFLYNKAHRDHFHIDDGTAIKFSSQSTSRVLFLQAALTHIHDIPVLIDGLYGPQTISATKDALKAIDSSGKIENTSTWKKFLLSTAEVAFKSLEKELTPPELLQHIHTTLENEIGDTEQRKRVEVAVNAFTNHEDTQTWLSAYTD